MFNPGWIFVIASIIAVLGIVYTFKQLMSSIDTKLEKGDEVNTQALQKENNRFFMRGC
ncbi:hypothetical protein [Anaerobacillus arseniciselenatis]|uniref:hypothetical protein n=1 Tax=Anaerobacillus arseniciselenatis TaxID=85682 RepID=UPI0014716BC4|nr:hypothetical protein [Anaerobacillus arseniciselenatis]